MAVASAAGPLVEEIFRKVLTSHVYDVVRETPLDTAVSLSRRLENRIGQEILRQSLGRLNAVFVPVGGGLISGIACFLKSLVPKLTVIGVQPFEADAMYQSIREGRRVVVDDVGLFADGVAVREVGRLTFPLVQQTVDQILRVTNDEICAVIKDVFDDTRTIMEPAGALAVAGLRRFVEMEGVKRATLVAVLSGANMDFENLGFVAERTRHSVRPNQVGAPSYPHTGRERSC